MVYEWKDKVILITGAAGGIGSNIIRLALEEGAKQVYIIDIDKINAVALQNELNYKYGEGKVKFIKCDVTNERKLISSYESVLGDKNREYVVIHSAAILNDRLEAYRKQIDINVKALITGSLTALDLMRADDGGKGGAIINMSSVVALHPLPYTPIYNATKSAVMQFSVGIGDLAIRLEGIMSLSNIGNNVTGWFMSGANSLNIFNLTQKKAKDYYERTRVRVLTMCFGATDTGLIAFRNIGCYDAVMEARIEEALKIYPGQSPQSAARAVIDAYINGESGSVWLSSSDKPVENITEKYWQAYRILSDPIFSLNN